ncbi:Na+/H+ antiporter NhaA [Reyranella sp.]|uniref:Na+/H+ antiporter NhaA n=1 Tax=Reyranella sp. TaxID=1929291 RepID=UPI0040371993
MTRNPQVRPTLLRRFIDNEASGGIVLMAAAALALIVANSALAPTYFAALKAYVGPLSVSHWINDALMAVFFLLVGLEIKREIVDGQLSTWSRRILPGLCAAGGMAVPALIFAGLNWNNGEVIRGWAIPTATDIAFALGVLSLFGNRVPASMKVFLTALAIIDDLGAVLIIAIFYTGNLDLAALGGAAAVLVALLVLNRLKVRALWPYLMLGVGLWVLVLLSGVHATVAGVALALTIPIGRPAPGGREPAASSPLHTLEHALIKVVPFFIIPIFGFANAGVSFAGFDLGAFADPLTLGVAGGLVVGKVIGVYGTAMMTVKFGWADGPTNAAPLHVLGVSLLCGIGFTMSLFIGLLAFPDSPALQDGVKIGILLGSFVSAVLGTVVLLLSPRPGGVEARAF